METFTAPTKTYSKEYKLENFISSFRSIGDFVEDLRFTGRRYDSTAFSKIFDHFTNLSSLTFDYGAACGFKSGDLAKIFDNSGHSLKHLNISEIRFLQDK